MRRKFIYFAPLFFVGFLALIALGGYIVAWLWNWLLPPLFGWPAITFWQALALLALCRILFGGWHGHGGGGHRRNDLRTRLADRMADRVADHWDRMSPEERERFRQRIRERCGFDPTSPA